MKIVYAIAISLFFTSGAFADTASVTNTVKTSVSTGGNTSSGAVTEGKSEASIKVYTEVNGETITDFEEKYEGRDINVVKEFNYGQSAATASIKVKTDVGTKDYPPKILKENSGEQAGTSSATTTAEELNPIRKMFVRVKNWFRNVFSIFR